MKRLLQILLLACCALMVCTAATPSAYDTLKLKADRFFDQKEWASSAVYYGRMLQDRPEVAATYGRAIVAEGMKGNREGQMALVARALDHHVAFDSLFSRVRQVSFSLGKSHLYEKFLYSVAEGYPWMRRTIEGYLLKYYAYRRNGADMVVYADKMLAQAPDNVGFLTTRAEGYMLCGEFDQGLASYRDVLSADPDNYHALLSLGNWYADKDPVEAVAFLSRAEALRPTPYLTAKLQSLKGEKEK